jgi:cytosine/uracil/thiamine/allantoin permease
MIADYFIVRRRSLNVDDLYRRGGEYEYSKGVNPRALVSLALGIALALLGLAIPALRWLYDYAWFVGFAVSAGVLLDPHVQKPFRTTFVPGRRARSSSGDNGTWPKVKDPLKDLPSSFRR